MTWKGLEEGEERKGSNCRAEGRGGWEEEGRGSEGWGDEVGEMEEGWEEGPVAMSGF